jgi:cadmium resistance protein CadD (predicted permease)
MTKREIIFLITLGVLMITVSLLQQFASFEMTESWEAFLLVFIGFPLGLWVAIDPERVKNKYNPNP